MFHLAMTRLGPGSIIQPGNMGRLTHRYMRPGANMNGYGDLWILAREVIFEHVRERNFANKPSRLNSSFICPDQDSLDLCRRIMDSLLLLVAHEVEVVDPNAAQHLGAVRWLDLAAPGQPFLDTTHMSAQQYWSGDPNGPMEIVTDSPMRVLKCLD
jgi:hypothetical protein